MKSTKQSYKEFNKNRKALGEASIESPFWQWYSSKPLLLSIATELSTELPLVCIIWFILYMLQLIVTNDPRCSSP